MIKKYFLIICSFFVVIHFASSQNSPSDNDLSQKMRAVYIYNFTRYFVWNSTVSSDEFKIGTLGADEKLIKELNKMSEVKTVAGKRIKIVEFKKESDITQTEMLYIDYLKFKKLNFNYRENTLIISDNSPDIKNSMLTFITTKDNKLKFAVNENLVNKSGLLMHESLKEHAVAIISGKNKQEDEQKIKNWEVTVLEKLSDLVKNNGSDIKLSKKEAEDILKIIDEKKNAIFQKEKEIHEKSQILNRKEKVIDQQKQKIDVQLNKIESQLTIIYLVVFLILAISVALIIAYLNNKNKQKANLQLQAQKREIEIQKQEVEIQKQVIESHNREIKDSIVYAQRLQQAILPPIEFFSDNLADNFILYRPKDIVAGDFYWAESMDNKLYIAAADSTGHGVPGALVSVICSNALNRSIKEYKLSETGKILDKARDLVLETFAKSKSDVKDGMDISVLCIDKEKNKIYWSGANNPLWFIENGTLKEIKPDKQPIGKTDNPRPFTTHELEYKENLTFYLFTDGLADQFGGPKGKKFKYKQLEEILVSINDKTMQEQSVIVNQKFEFWKGELEQVDDVCIIGLRI